MTVSCPRFALQMFTTFAVSNPTPVVNLDFSTGNRYTVHLSIYFFFLFNLHLCTPLDNDTGLKLGHHLNILYIYVGHGSAECMWCGRDNSDQRCWLSNQVRKIHRGSQKYPRRFLILTAGLGNVCIRAKCSIRPAPISSFSCMKRRAVFLL